MAEVVGVVGVAEVEGVVEVVEVVGAVGVVEGGQPRFSANHTFFRLMTFLCGHPTFSCGKSAILISIG